MCSVIHNVLPNRNDNSLYKKKKTCNGIVLYFVPVPTCPYFTSLSIRIYKKKKKRYVTTKMSVYKCV